MGLTGLRALLVEDESTTRVLLTEVLRARGFAVTPCGTAEEGWEAFRENDYPLVILNWMLPGMSGLDLCRQLRRHPRGETSVVLMVTGRTSPNDLRNALAAGADDYLAKPVDGALLNVRLQVAESRVHEIRQRRRAEDERRKIELKMQQAQKLESLGVLAGGIAHDFNNLLVGILGHAGIVLMDLNQDSPHRHAIEQIERAAVRASELTNQMLAYSGKGQLVVEAVQINDVVQEMANLLLVSKGKAASLVYDFADDLPFIEVDPTQLRQVIMNLITNASDAIGEGPGTIRLSTEMTEVGTNEDDSQLVSDELRPGTYVALDVSDDGCGMDERTLSRIFDPFFTTKSTGRGLGLAAVMGIIRSHRGGIQVNSAPNRGTSFRVMLPAALRAGDGQFGRRTAVRVGEEWATGGVLVVDPEPGVRAVVRVLLERIGFTVLLAMDVDEGLQVLADYGDMIVAVVVDPDIDAAAPRDVLGGFREVRAAIPIIACSRDASRFPQTGANGTDRSELLRKPYRPAALIEKLRAVLEATDHPLPAAFGRDSHRAD